MKVELEMGDTAVYLVEEMLENEEVTEEILEKFLQQLLREKLLEYYSGMEVY